MRTSEVDTDYSALRREFVTSVMNWEVAEARWQGAPMMESHSTISQDDLRNSAEVIEVAEKNETRPTVEGLTDDEVAAWDAAAKLADEQESNDWSGYTTYVPQREVLASLDKVDQPVEDHSPEWWAGFRAGLRGEF